MFFLKTALRSNIDLTPDDWSDPFFDTGAIECHCTIHDAMVCDGNGVLPERLCFFRDLIDTAETIQKGILRMDM